MSLGIGVGDIASAILLARTLYKKCRDSPGQYQQLTSDVLQLANVLEDLEDLAKQRHLEPSRQKRLLEHMDAANKVLIDGNKLLDDYGKMSSKSRGVFDRLGWDQEDARDIRTGLTATVTMINTFYQRLSTSEFIQLQKKLDLWMAEMNAGHRDTDSVSLVVSGNKSMQNSAWPQIIKDLATFGVGEEVVNANRSFIVTAIIDAFNAGQLLDVETIKGDVEATLRRTSLDDLEDAFRQNRTGTPANLDQTQMVVDDAEIVSNISGPPPANELQQRVVVGPAVKIDSHNLRLGMLSKGQARTEKKLPNQASTASKGISSPGLEKEDEEPMRREKYHRDQTLNLTKKEGNRPRSLSAELLDKVCKVVTDGDLETHQFFSMDNPRQIRSLSFSRCENLIASGSGSGNIKVWDMDKGSQLAGPNGSWPDIDVVIVCFSPDDRRLMTADWWGNIRLWEIREEESVYKIEAAK